MDNLLEYARFTFEEKYCSDKKFKCVKSEVEDAFCKCICIPGIAFNYIINAIKYCYQEFAGDADKTNIIWNEEYKVYVAESMINNNQKVIVNFRYDININSCYYAKDICKVSPSDFVYLKIRPDNGLEYIHYMTDMMMIVSVRS